MSFFQASELVPRVNKNNKFQTKQTEFPPLPTKTSQIPNFTPLNQNRQIFQETKRKQMMENNPTYSSKFSASKKRKSTVAPRKGYDMEASKECLFPQPTRFSGGPLPNAFGNASASMPESSVRTFTPSVAEEFMRNSIFNIIGNMRVTDLQLAHNYLKDITKGNDPSIYMEEDEY